MSTFDDASLVFIPSGYKTSKAYSVKPTDGSGDLAFTRSNDTATRVGPDGLIEKVRTNVLTYSQTFSDASWLIGTGETKTDSQTDPNGGTTAVLISNVSEANGYMSKALTLTANVPYTFSIYIKGASSGSVSLRLDDSTAGPQFDINYTTSWQRFSVTRTVDQASCFLTVGGYSTWAIGENIQFAFAQVETGDVATDYIATTTAAVSVGPVANVPRLDYLNSSCPRLLLEPQRQNISGFIESGTGNYVTATVTNPANPLSILGLRSFRVTTDFSTGDAPRISNATDYQSGTTYTASAYFDLSQTNATNIELAMFGFGSPTGSAVANLNVSTKAVTTTATSGAWSAQSGKVTLISGSIYRLEITATAAQTFSGSRLYCSAAANAQYVEVAGIQIEAGAYATSFISKPTTAAATRGADTYQKGGFGNTSTAGTLFYEFEATKISSPNAIFLVQLYAGSTVGSASFMTANAIGIVGNGPSVFCYNNGYSTTLASITPTAGASLKIALRYDGTNVVAFINGVKGTVFADGSVGAKNAIRVNNGEDGAQATKQLLFFPTALSDAQCIELTA